jgi:hypothetical protein
MDICSFSFTRAIIHWLDSSSSWWRNTSLLWGGSLYGLWCLETLSCFKCICCPSIQSSILVFGTFKFNRLPMGLKTSPNSFQLLMDKILNGLSFRVLKMYISFVQTCIFVAISSIQLNKID